MNQLIWQLPVYALAAGIAVFAVNWLALIPWRRAATAHWTERARLLWPVRVSASANIFLVPAGVGAFHLLVMAGSGAACGLAAGAAWLGTLLGTYPLDHEMFPELSFSKWLRAVASAWVLRFGTLFVPVVGAWFMPPQFGWATVLIAVIVLANHLWLNFGGLLRVLRLLGRLTPADNRLESVVQETSARMKVPVRRTWLLESIAAQALALPATRDLIFTSRLLELSTDEEISAICAHELAHLSESRGTLAVRIVGTLAFYPVVFIRPLIETFGPVGPLLALIAFVLILRLHRKLSLRMERRADGLAVEQQGPPGIYASALEKLYRANQVPAVGPKRKTTHPDLYDRLLAAGVTPDYSRPAAPDSKALPSVVLNVGVGILLGVALVHYFSQTGP